MEVYIGLAIAGIFIGLFSGLLGVGGGTLMVPIFNVGAGLPSIVSTATSLFTIIPTSISGVVTHVRKKTCDLKLGFSMGIGGACASPIGVLLAQASPEWLVVCCVALILVYSAYTTLRKALSEPKTKLTPAKASASSASKSISKDNSCNISAVENKTQEGSFATEDSKPTDSQSKDSKQTPVGLKRFFIAFLIGFIAGLAGGYVGLGGGFIMVPLMSSWLGFPMRLASGTSLIGIFCIAIPGSITQAMLGNVDFLSGICVACGSIPGAIIGANLVSKIPDRTLRFMFAGFLGIAALAMILKQFNVL